MPTSTGRDEGDAGAGASVSALTRAREAVTPYLPPPAVAAMRAIDSHPVLSSFTDEVSMALISSFLLGLALIHIVRAASGAAFRRSTIHEDGGDDVLGGSGAATSSGSAAGGGGRGTDLGDFGETVVLFGPSGGGKTILFGGLCRSGGKGRQATVPLFTVTSTKANFGLVLGKYHEGRISSKTPVRIIDYPGHPSLSSQLSSVLRDADRAVLVLDSTRPVAEAAEALYSALADESVRSSWCSRRGGTVPILVACAKSDAGGAKNWRRIKIQMRTELERLRRVGSATAAAEAARQNGESLGGGSGGSSPLLPLGGPGGILDLDRLKEYGAPVSLSFLSVSGRDGSGLDELRDFVSTGFAGLNAPAIFAKSRKE